MSTPACFNSVRLAIICFLVISEGTLFGADNAIRTPETSRTPSDLASILSSPSFTHQERWAIARTANSITSPQRQELHGLISDTQQGDAWYYALTALVSAHDTSSVSRIAEELARNDNRYYALALGVLGDKTAIPGLENTARETQREHVRNDALLALRMLRASPVLRPPPPSLAGPVLLSLAVSQTNISVGEPFVLKAMVKNLTSTPLPLDGQDIFFNKYLKVYSTNNEQALPLRRYIDFDPSPQNLIGASTSATAILSNVCSILIEDVTHEGWSEVLKGRKVFVMRNSQGTWAFDLGSYEIGKQLDIELALVYEQDARSQIVDRFPVEGLLITNSLVSNHIRIRIKDRDDVHSSSDDSFLGP